MISVIVPVFNEENAVEETIGKIYQTLSSSFSEFEIIAINDGSEDKTLERLNALRFPNFKVLNHPENLGYGRSLYDGIVAARHECICIIDGDGSYPAEKIPELFKYFPQYDMVVGARSGQEIKKGVFKRPARLMFKFLAEYATGRPVLDVNSGFRVFRRSIIMKFQDSLCAGFSFTTTITLLFMLNHYFVKYVPIEYLKRTGSSKVRHFRDTLRALQIIIETFLFYNPIKLFLLIAIINFTAGSLLGLANYFFFHSLLISVAAGIMIASLVPFFTLGLIADQLRKVYHQRT